MNRCRPFSTPSLLITADGSHTLYLQEWDETYHSRHGALTESLHVFIQHGFYYPEENPVRILEVGFGTGLNAWLTAIEAEKSRKKVFYHAFDDYPLDRVVIASLNYPSLPHGKGHESFFFRIHEAPWNETVALSPFFDIQKTLADLTTASLAGETYHLIYYDAFAPSKQPALWTEEILKTMYLSLTAGGVLVTYCAKGEVQRILRRCGFTVEKLPGPPGGKREMIRAKKEKNS